VRVQPHSRPQRGEDILASVHPFCRQQRVQVIEALADKFRELRSCG
jgi:hypothetical protein